MATQLGISFAVVVGLFAVTLLVVGISLSRLTRDVVQINEKTLPYVLVVDGMDLSRSEVEQLLTEVALPTFVMAIKKPKSKPAVFWAG